MPTPQDHAQTNTNQLRRNHNRAAARATQTRQALDDAIADHQGLSTLLDTLLDLTPTTDLTAGLSITLDPAWGVRSPMGHGILTEAAVWTCVMRYVHDGDAEPLLRVTAVMQRRVDALAQDVQHRAQEHAQAAQAAQDMQEALELRGML